VCTTCKKKKKKPEEEERRRGEEKGEGKEMEGKEDWHEHSGTRFLCECSSHFSELDELLNCMIGSCFSLILKNYQTVSQSSCSTFH
jgi:hypothetical protein